MFQKRSNQRYERINSGGKAKKSNRLASQAETPTAEEATKVAPKVDGTPEFLPDRRVLPDKKSITEEIIMENIDGAKKKWQNIYEQYLAEAKARNEGCV